MKQQTFEDDMPTFEPCPLLQVEKYNILSADIKILTLTFSLVRLGAWNRWGEQRMEGEKRIIDRYKQRYSTHPMTIN